jgi:lipoprotein signal peptidase
MAQCCSYRSMFWGLAALGVVADQVSKYRVFRWLFPDSRINLDGSRTGDREIIQGIFRLQTWYMNPRETGSGLLAHFGMQDHLDFLRSGGGEFIPQVNQGALFGLGNTHGGLANTIFALISVIAAAAIIYWGSRRTTSRDGTLTMALGLILAGTLGNLYDRVVFDGVRDFLFFYYINWPVFNVADCCLVCGAFLLLVQAFWVRTPKSQPALAETAKQGEAAGV